MSIVAKIEKLLALAADGGASENEREQAIRVASKLMEQHKIEQSDLYRSSPSKIVVVNKKLWEGANDHMLIQDSMLGCCCEYLFGIKTYSWTHIVMSNNKPVRRSQMWAIGDCVDVDAAIKFFLFARTHMLLSSKGRKFTQKQLHDFRRGFAFGLYDRIRRMVEGTKSARTEEQSQSIAIYDADKQKSIEEEFSKLGARTSKAKTFECTSSYFEGARASLQVQIDHGKTALGA